VEPVALRRSGLGPGEAAAIALALELSADALLIDDRDARREARDPWPHDFPSARRGLDAPCVRLYTGTRRSDGWTERRGSCEQRAAAPAVRRRTREWVTGIFKQTARALQEEQSRAAGDDKTNPLARRRLRRIAAAGAIGSW
jgi:hypothetical protein